MDLEFLINKQKELDTKFDNLNGELQNRQATIQNIQGEMNEISIEMTKILGEYRLTEELIQKMRENNVEGEKIQINEE